MVAETAYDPWIDPIILGLIDEAEADPDVLGVVLTGSRALGITTVESDYDVMFLVADTTMERYEQQGTPQRGLAAGLRPDQIADIWHERASAIDVDRLAWWMLPMYADALLLFDRDGRTRALLDAVCVIPNDRIRQTVSAAYDGYLNELYRSLKCWRRGNMLGGRLEAADSATPLLQTLYALEGYWAPYGSRLRHHLHKLERQGWQPGEIESAVLDLITTGDPRRQQLLARRVTTLVNNHGYQHIYDDWDGQIERALAWQFDELPPHTAMPH